MFYLVLLFLTKSTFAQQNLFAQQNNLEIDNIAPTEKQFRVVYEWRTLDFAYNNEYDRGRARQNGEYIERNILISDVKAFANRLYVTLPRMLPGVPTTLGWIIAPENNGRSDPMIEPFPSWELNKEGDCWALQFVQGIAIDSDGILWAVDSGRIHTLRQDKTISTCPPKIILIDLKKNATIIHRYEFPQTVVARGTNYLNKIVVDDAVGGYAYITDNSGSDPGIVVYSRRYNRSWKIREPSTMRAASNAEDFAVNGTHLKFSIHIDGIALGPYYNPSTGATNSIENMERNIYYCPLSSYHLYSIPASILRDPEFSIRSTPRDVLSAITDYGLKPSQSDGMIMDNRGVLYYGLLKEHAIAQWDSFQPFTSVNQHVIAKDDEFIQWTDGFTFDENGNLFVVVNRLHNFVAGRLNPNEVNFRILRARTGSLSYVYTTSPGYTSIDLITNRNILDNDVRLSSQPTFLNSLDNNFYSYNSANSNTFLSLNIHFMIIQICLLYFMNTSVM